MRLLLSVFITSLTTGCGLLDKTPGEAMYGFQSWIDNVVGTWFANLLDDRVTLGDIVVYVIVGGIAWGILGSIFGSVTDANNNRRRAVDRQRLEAEVGEERRPETEADRERRRQLLALAERDRDERRRRLALAKREREAEEDPNP